MVSLPHSSTRARAVLAKTFTATATIMRKSVITDDMGGFTDTYVAHDTNVPCSFSRYLVRPFERERDVRILEVMLWTFVFDLDVDILNTDRIVVGTRTFEVVNANAGSSDLALRPVCMEVT